MIGAETSANMLPAIQPIFERKKEIWEKGCDVNSSTCTIINKDSNITMYDLHDGKMLYLMTQHSLFNRKHHPFLLCQCQRGEGVQNANHECKIINHDDQVKYYDRSERRWNNKRNCSGEASWTLKQHRDWVDKENYGISHFGLHPDLLRCDNIAFDVFHLCCAVIRKPMDYLQKFTMKQSQELQEEFQICC